ncbi:MAG: GNAT family N-acetyltransferase [Gammaproteobacteria bacterium]|nr:GNAT family N-acetyltransferase [Gammaproteobacteria bacterium]
MSAICAIDHIAHAEEERRQFICRSVRDGIAFVAESDGEIIGYSVLEHSFFARGFIAMLMVRPDRRRSGIGSELVRHVEGLCASDRIFTSTNESNLPMQSLLRKLGYKLSGKVDDLEPGDPELFYSRQLRSKLGSDTIEK